MCHKHYRDPAETAYMHQESVGAPRFSPLQNSAKIILPLHDIVNLLKIGQNSAPSFISSLKPLNNYLQYDRDRKKHHIPQINVFTNKIHSIFTKQFCLHSLLQAMLHFNTQCIIFHNALCSKYFYPHDD